MTNSEVNETIARALGFRDVTPALGFMGDGGLCTVITPRS